MCGKAGSILRGSLRMRRIGVCRDRVREDHILRWRTQDIIPMRTTTDVGFWMQVGIEECE